MAHHPMWRPDPEKPVPPDPVPNEPAVEKVRLPSDPTFQTIETSPVAKSESDFAELAAKFAAHGGGKIPLDLSRELALDVVLNEIAEQACAITGATGAAIALAGGAEMVCRASSGEMAPELGTRMDTNSGLSGECVRSRRMQHCDDALADPTADAEVSRQLGVRSVMVLPLLQDDKLIGIFEILSARPAAFGEREERALEVLAERILINTRARHSPSTAPDPGQTVFDAEPAQSRKSTDVEFRPAEELSARYDSAAGRGELETTGAETAAVARFDWLSTLMSGIIMAVALLMATVFAMRMGWLKSGEQRRAHPIVNAQAAAWGPDSSPKTPNADALSGAPLSEADRQRQTTSAQSESRFTSRIPEGGLRVYENGKEIFRADPQTPKVVELSPDAAKGSLIRRIEPDYPEAALEQHVQGPVQLDVHIAEDGSVQEIELISGSPLLVDAATAAVRQWRFKPHIVNGRAVQMETRITLNFTLPPR